MSIVIFDLDGTLALISHRRHFVENGNRDWDGFFGACDKDEPNWPVIDVYHAMRDAGHHVLIWSGRSDAVRDKTESWLEKHLGHVPRLRMRKAGDYTPDHTLKERWLDELGTPPAMVFDDRTRVVNMWRDRGVTCFQVAPGDF